MKPSTTDICSPGISSLVQHVSGPIPGPLTLKEVEKMFGPDLILMFVIVYGMALISLIVGIKEWIAANKETGGKR